MKPLILFALLMLVGCGEKTQEDAERRVERRTDLVRIRQCDYIFLYNMHDDQLIHAGDCPNPKHGEGNGR